MDTVTDRLISCSTYSADLSTEQTQALEMRGGLSFREHLNSVSPYIPAVFLNCLMVYVPCLVTHRLRCDYFSWKLFNSTCAKSLDTWFSCVAHIS